VPGNHYKNVQWFHLACNVPTEVILKFQGYFYEFSEARDLFGIIFQIPGAFMKIGGLRVDTQEV
jgi:hypothetical protein